MCSLGQSQKRFVLEILGHALAPKFVSAFCFCALYLSGRRGAGKFRSQRAQM